MDMHTLKKNLSALLECHKSGIPINDLQGLFAQEFGYPINYKKYGCENVLDFMYGQPDIVRVEQGGKGVDKLFFPAGTQAPQNYLTGKDEIATHSDEEEANSDDEWGAGREVDYTEKLQDLLGKSDTANDREKKVKSTDAGSIPDQKQEKAVSRVSRGSDVASAQVGSPLYPQVKVERRITDREREWESSKMSPAVAGAQRDKAIRRKQTKERNLGYAFQGAEGFSRPARRDNVSAPLYDFNSLWNPVDGAKKMEARKALTSLAQTNRNGNLFQAPPNLLTTQFAPDLQEWMKKLKNNTDGLLILRMPVQTGSNLEDLKNVFAAYGSSGIEEEADGAILVSFDNKEDAARTLVDMAYAYKLTIAEECNATPGSDPYGTKVLREEHIKPFDASSTPSVYVGHIPDDVDIEEILDYFEKFDVIGWKLQMVRTNRHALIYIEDLVEAQTAACIVQDLAVADQILVTVSISKDTERLILLGQTSNAGYMPVVANSGRELPRERDQKRNPTRATTLLEEERVETKAKINAAELAETQSAEKETDNRRRDESFSDGEVVAQDEKNLIENLIEMAGKVSIDEKYLKEEDGIASEEIAVGEDKKASISWERRVEWRTYVSDTDEHQNKVTINGLESPTSPLESCGGARPKLITPSKPVSEIKDKEMKRKDRLERSEGGSSFSTDQAKRYRQELADIEEDIHKLQKRREDILTALMSIQEDENAMALPYFKSISNESMPSLEDFESELKGQLPTEKVEPKIAQEVPACANATVSPKQENSENPKFSLAQAVPACENATVSPKQEKLENPKFSFAQAGGELTHASPKRGHPEAASEPGNFLAYVLGQETDNVPQDTSFSLEVPPKMGTQFLKAMMNCCFPGKHVWVPPIGSKIEIAVTCKEKRSGYFWAQIKDENLMAFTSLHNKIQDFANSCQPIGTDDKRGIAPFEEEHFRCWISRLPNSRVRVFFVDYGNEVVLSAEKVLSVPEEVWNLPPTARAFKFTGSDASMETAIEVSQQLKLVTDKPSQEFIINVASVELAP